MLAQRTGKPLNEAAVWQRMLVMAAGAVMNFVLGFVVLLLLISLRSEPITSKVIYAVEDNALCGQTGLQAGDEIVELESSKAVQPLISPVAGTVKYVNRDVADDPSVVNGDPYGEGWLLKVELDDDEPELLSADEYAKGVR